MIWPERMKARSDGSVRERKEGGRGGDAVRKGAGEAMDADGTTRGMPWMGAGVAMR